MPLACQGCCCLTVLPPCLSSSQAWISEAHSAAEKAGSSVNCQPPAVFLKSDTFGADYLLFCLLEYNLETW